ncbi:RluA family pseudouridine synthase [Paenibacillus terrigena]|uniref:RluA family pseudouridine synthase n=1 Tax=Paenibacillus terrigena TaxID=369333 RepID=UPI00039A356B|nr:RluA family pseudouridine synthase [Paenibacillus terrigena]
MIPERYLSPEQWIRKGEWLVTTAPQSSLHLPEKLASKLAHRGDLVKAGDRLRVRLFPEETDPIPAYWTELEVLYEDDFCMVVNKPAGMLVHPTVPDQVETLANAVASYYACSGQQHRVRHIHRLDEYTTGPVLYAKNEFSQIRLDEAMREKAIERVYVAFVQGIVDPKLHKIDAPIGKDRHHKQRRRVSPTGDHAVTHVELIETFPHAGVSLVRLQLETGRTHQIRVHMNHAGHPLLGDTLYGGRDEYAAYQALHGELLRFQHPMYGEWMEVEAPWTVMFKELYAKFSGSNA